MAGINSIRKCLEQHRFETRGEAVHCRAVVEHLIKKPQMITPHCVRPVANRPEQCSYSVEDRPTLPPLQPCALSTRFRLNTDREVAHAMRCAGTLEREHGKTYSLTDHCIVENSAALYDRSNCALVIQEVK